MKAVTFSEEGGPEVLRYEEVADPVAGEGEAVVAVRFAAVNHFDLDLRRGFRFELSFPHILGLESAGDVVAVGPGVDESLVGTAVIPRFLQPTYEMLGVHLPGSYAELVKVPAASLMAKPESLSYEDASAIQLSFSATWRALSTRAGLQAGETVLVNGSSGAVGTAAMQLAKHIGARVIASGGDDAKLARCRELGADEVVNVRSEDLVARVRELTDGAGANVVMEGVGGEIMEQSLHALAFGGRVVTIGAIAAEDVTVNIADLYLGEHALIGSVGSTPDEVDHVLALAAEGVVHPVIDRVLPLKDAAEAHRLIECREVFGRILLAP